MSRELKILFVSGTLPPEESATAHVIEAVSKELIKAGCSIDGLTVKRSFSEEKHIVYNGMSIYKTDTMLYSAREKKCLKDILFAIWRRFDKRKQKTSVYKEWVVRALVKHMEHISMEQYDWVIPVCAYYEAAEAVCRFKEKHGIRVKIALYQVDPIVGNEAYRRDPQELLEVYEKYLYSVSDHVFTTPIIFKQKQKNGWNMNEVTALELPISVQPRQMKLAKHDEIRCVYAGYLYGKLRDAAATLALFSQLRDLRIQLYFVGSGQEELLETYANGELKGRLHLLGPKTARECDEILESADVLINIGNSVNNQVPSKLLYYFGFGKPVLNITACEDCPSLPYVEKYSLAMNVDGTGQVQEHADTVEEWILDNCRQRVPYDQVQSVLRTCTPSHIAREIISVLERKKRNE